MEVGELYRKIRDRFRDAGLPTPDLDAKYLLGSALGISLSELVFQERDSVPAGAISQAEAFAKERLGGKPVGRILGEREFYGRRFRLNPATLEPRPDTEILVDAVLERTEKTQTLTFCDIGTGTGAIAVTLLAELPRSFGVGVDISDRALRAAEDNAIAHQVADRFQPLCADYLSAFGKGFDWIISNPPYIRSQDLMQLNPEVARHDPAAALDGGEDGLNAYRQIISQAWLILDSGGRVALEIGFDQAGAVREILSYHGFGGVFVIQDLAGCDRVVVAEKP